MARPLTLALDQAMQAETRLPGFRIEVYDIRSTSQEVSPTFINDVVLANLNETALPSIVGPRDFTADIQAVSFTETAGDYIANGIAASQILATVIDPEEAFDPVENPPVAGDLEADGRWLRQRNVVVIYEGDLSVDPAEWPITFTGSIQGQPGQDRNRTGGVSQIQFKAASREVDFIRRENTTRNFFQNTTYDEMIQEIAETDMGLDLDEINLPTFTTRTTSHRSTQFLIESPLVSIAKIMFLDGFMPRFQGDGRLNATSGAITKGPTRFYPDSDLIRSITRPIVEQNGINEVKIVGLNPNQTAVIQARQDIARASITSGFFANKQSIKVRWSDDETQQAFNVRLEIDSSIGDGLFNFGGESFTNFPNPDDGGSTSGKIDVDGALIASIAAFAVSLGLYLFTSAEPEPVFVFGGPTAQTGFMFPQARIVHAFAGSVLFTLLASVGYGRYRVTGQPYEYVFEIITCTARLAGIRNEDRNSIEIENHLINSDADCDDIAERVFRRERAKQNRRAVSMIHDLALEPDDVFEVGSGLNARRYMINSITRILQRGGQHLAALDCFEITPGVKP